MPDMPTSEHWRFAEDRIARTWRSNFRIGLLVRFPNWDYDVPRRRHARLKGKERAQRPFNLELEARKFSEFADPIIGGVLDRKLAVADAREKIRCVGYESSLFIVETREDLIDTITRILDEGCNCWDSGGEWAWNENGVFQVNFWYDRSHDHSGRK